jgi:hypothetical protein
MVTFPLIDGWPWGWGACQVDTPPKGWTCPDCGWVCKLLKDGSAAHGRHTYLFGGERCTSCAEKWCKAYIERVEDVPDPYPGGRLF